jgi:hypothetical protein
VKKLNKRFEKVENSVFSFFACPCFQDICNGCSYVETSADTTQVKINQLESETRAILQAIGGK